MRTNIMMETKFKELKNQIVVSNYTPYVILCTHILKNI